MWCRSSSSDSKNHERRKYECLIPFMPCGRGMACGGIADFFPHNGVISVAATRPLQQKVSVVCIPAIFLFLLTWTLINSYPSFQDASNSDEGLL